MPTLEINGVDVEVDDSFLRMSPEQQKREVDEIGRRLGMLDAPQSQQPEGITSNFGAATDAHKSGLLFNFDDEISAGMLAPIEATKNWIEGNGFDLGQAYTDLQQGFDARKQARDEHYPVASTVGKIGGAVTSAAGLGRAGLSVAGKVAQKGMAARVAGGTADAAILSGIDGAGNARPGSRTDNAMESAAYGAAFGAGMSAAGNAVASAGRRFFGPGKAQTQVVEAIAKDRAAGSGVRSKDIAIAGQHGVPGMVIDAGGSNTKALARDAIRKSELAKETFSELGNRTAGSGARATDFVKGLVNGNTDDLVVQAELKSVARAVNSPAYKAAHAADWNGAPPAALKGLLERIPASAIKEARSIAKAEGRHFGQHLIAHLDEAGDIVKFSREPSLREMDYIQRGLRTLTDMKFRTGAGHTGSAFKDLRKEILEVMDSASPQFAKARAGASAFFGASDALEAGRKAMSSTRKAREIMNGFSKFSEPEKELFRIGFASEMSQRIARLSDRSNAIDRLFGNPEARAKLKVIYGQAKLKEAEAMLRVEASIRDLARLSNIQTQQPGNPGLIEMLSIPGMGAGAGGFLGGGDATHILAGAAMGLIYKAGTAAVRGRRNVVSKKIAVEIADALTNQDPQKIDALIRRAGKNQTVMHGIKAVDHWLNSVVAGSAPMGGQAIQNRIDQAWQ